MLMLVFQLGASRYALDVRGISEVAPYARLEPLARAPAYVAGLFDFRGELVPVIDLCRLVGDVACKAHMTSRIMLVAYRLPGGEQRLLGLLAEQVTETLKLDPASFTDAGVRVDDTPFLGDIARDESGMIRLLRPDQLLSPAVRDLLFAAEES